MPIITIIQRLDMFSTVPSAQLNQDLTINFYLKHFRQSTVSYILEQTGYKSITEYEILARSTDLFPARISVNGFLRSERPDVDESLYAVYELSLHHLASHVLDRIMTYYIGMNQTDYELLYPDTNTLYVYVPYRTTFTEDEFDYEEDVEEDVQQDVQQDVEEEDVDETEEEEESVPVRRTVRRIVVESDSESDEETVDDEQTTKPLDGWSFKLNITTKNSFVLRPKLSKPSDYTFQDGLVFIPGFGSTPTTWNAPIEGLERPLYYNKKYGGWIVSLRLEDALIKAGAFKY